MDALLAIVQKINLYLSDYILIILLIGAGLYFSIRTKFVQVRCFGEGWRRVFGNFSLKGGKHGGGMSSFQALATAIAAQVGTGNIVGACGAILIGGPGAIFWMWIIAFFGMATIYAEAVLAQETRVVQADGTVQGGPVYYIKTAFKGGFGKFLAGFFAVAIILALGFMGAMVQSNSIGEACHTAFGIPTWVVGLIIAILAAVIFIGGVQRLASVTEKLVPIMAFLYIIGGLIVLIARIKYIPETFGMIFKYAFVPNAIIGGGIGYALKTAISQGVKRGLFSNEAGEGSAPNAAATAHITHPVKQGLLQSLGVFTDTLLICTCTAFIVLIAGLYNGDADGIVLTTQSLEAEIGPVGRYFITAAIFFFAYSSIIGNYFYGETNIRFVTNKPQAVFLFRIFNGGVVLAGAFMTLQETFCIVDLLMGLMTICNLIAITLLAKKTFVLLDDYKAQRKEGKDPVFHKSILTADEAKDIECWD